MSLCFFKTDRGPDHEWDGGGWLWLIPHRFRTSALRSIIADMLDDDDPEIETSPLSGDVTRDGITIRVEINKLAVGDEGWSLEVIDQENGSTIWEKTFATDQEAYAEFNRKLETEGIRSFAERPSGRPH